MKLYSRIFRKTRSFILEYSGKHEALFSNIPENTKLYSRIFRKTRSTGNRKTQHLEKLTRPWQQITNNNNNSTKQHLHITDLHITYDQLAKRTSLQRDSSNSEDVQRRLSHLINSWFIYLP
ncbi:hypothetical protein AVEN_178018-1 [Araneus ventricosus]|uniref:Uncharacterized protein n=1 Tax=Araneus ventricosus TaxID=182803 RepID=A0A4Y2W870_ARAVE|nr:hypothetical protein AVEN_178018-1 [Araneus ventricosus]